jgi:hypothetical protein
VVPAGAVRRAAPGQLAVFRGCSPDVRRSNRKACPVEPHAQPLAPARRLSKAIGAGTATSSQAAAGFDLAGMTLYAAVARRRLAALQEGAGPPRDRAAG